MPPCPICGAPMQRKKNHPNAFVCPPNLKHPEVTVTGYSEWRGNLGTTRRHKQK